MTIKKLLPVALTITALSNVGSAAAINRPDRSNGSRNVATWREAGTHGNQADPIRYMVVWRGGERENERRIDLFHHQNRRDIEPMFHT